MGLGQDEKELIFRQSKESMQEVVGWKNLIFLPQSTTWKFFMIASVLVKCLYIITRAAYMADPYLYGFVNLVCDTIHLVDFFFALMHFCLKNTRKLKEGKRRHAFLLLVDSISLMPLEMIYEYCVYSVGEKNERVCNVLSLIGCLRFYQIPKNFSDTKDSIYKAEVYVIVTFFQVLSYFVLLTHCLSSFIYLYFNEDQKKACLDKFLFCVIENVLETSYLLCQSYVLPISNYPLHEYKVLLILDFSLGYIFTFAFVIPLSLFVSIKCLFKYFEYSRNLRHVSVLTKKVVKNEKLRKKILEYYKESGSFGRNDQPPEILNVFPLCLRKYIFCDMHWEAIRHSFLLQDLSLGCKRSLSLHMKTEFLLPKTKLFEKNKNPTYFLYLESGLLQVMSEENSSAPVLSLSGGTVLGEISYFLHRNSLATVAAARFSIIHTLSFRSLFQVLMDYPSDRRKLLHRVKVRLKFARSKHEIKTKIYSQFALDVKMSKSMGETKQGNIKWIKNQFRAIYDLKKVEELMEQRQYTVEDYERRILNLDTQMTHTSVYLPFLSVSDENAQKQGAVCLKKYPWLMDPHCQFVLLWREIIRFIVLYTVLIYPLYIGWFPHIPEWFFVMSWVVTFMFMNDIMLQFTTAFKKKNRIVQKFSCVVLHRINRLRFFADILAAFPLQILAYNKTHRFRCNLYFVNALLKVYTLLPAINKWNYTSKSRVFIRTMTKFLFYLVIIIYLTASVLYMTGVECVFYDCDDRDWYQSLIKKVGKVDGIYRSIIKAICLGYDIPEGDTEGGTKHSFLISWFFFIIFRLLYFALNGECIAAYVLERTYDVEHKRRMDIVFKFMGKRKMVGHVRDRVMAAMQFQWDYDKNNDIGDKQMLWESLSHDLREKIDRDYVLPVLAKSKLFASEDKPFLTDLCKKASRLALPANSVLLTLGSQTGRLYIIERGFVQINSFIAGDVHLNISKSISVKEGDTFPVIDVFSQTPAAISAVTVTECELLVLDLEDVLSTMMIHGIFKDFIEALKNTDLSALNSGKLAVSEYTDVHSDDGFFHRDGFAPLKGFGVVLRILLRKQAVNSHSSWYVYWELSRVLFIFVSLIAWPIALGCCPNPRYQQTLCKFFSFTDLLSLVDFYIRLHVAYYNEMGIYISHTLYTSSHYLLTTFVTDLAAFSPNFHVYYIIIYEMYDLPWFVIVVHLFLRSLSLYRVVGLLNYLKVSGRASSATQFVTVICFLVLGIHYYISVMLRIYITKENFPRFPLTKDNTEWDMCHEYYLNELGLIVSLALRSRYFLNSYDLFGIILSTTGATMGLIGSVWLSSHLALSLTTSNKTLATYQYYMQSFLHYLSRQRGDDKILNQAVEHFEYEFKQQLGCDPNEIFSTLPQTLHEEVMFLLYKKTLRAVGCLFRANENFFRTLSRNVKEVYLKEGSVIIYHKEVQSNIFFIHTGQCFVENSSQILFKGAMIGDIKRRGIMTNTITARTEVILLKIPSKIFFTTLNNFYITRLSYQSEVAHLDDFIVSVFIEEQHHFSDTFTTEKEELESEFVLASEAREEEERDGLKKKKKQWLLKRESKTAKILRFFFMLAAYLTVLIIPIFMAIRVFSPLPLLIIYALDVIYIAEIIVNSRFISSVDEKKYRHRRSRIFLKLVTFFKALFPTLAVFPIEIIPLAKYGIPVSDKCCYIMCFCYVNRLLRIIYIIQYFCTKTEKLLMNFYMNVFAILMFYIALINIFCSVNIMSVMGKQFEHLKCYKSLDASQKDALLLSYLCTLNDFIGGGMEICIPRTPRAIILQLILGTASVLSKSILISQVMMIIYITHSNKSHQMLQLEYLDNYLSVREVSPILRTRAQKYFCNLVNSFQEGGETFLLSSAPPFIRTNIMQDLYMHHISRCFVFRNLNDTFLKQLTARLYSNIFFPGDYITERGDVDHNIYFIHKGEVYCIKTDKYYKALEKATDLYISGDSFGVLQGIFPAYPHKETYRAKTLTVILVLNYHKWEDLRTAFPEVFESIYKSCMQSLA